MTRRKRSGIDGKPRPVKTTARALDSEKRRPWHRWLAFALVAAVVLTAVAYQRWSAPTIAPPPVRVASTPAQPATAQFVGAKACASCHAGEYAAWSSSQHAKAMQHADDATVLGDFNNAQFTYNGIVSTFFRRDGKFFVNTDGKDGALADFEIGYTFGLDPLQQYLVAFPDGRMQALPIAWDSRPKVQGGQHWYHLYPGDHITAKDPLHWTRLYQNWNWMCADCHTTKLDRNYDAATNTYATHWSEMNVACEACHGPASKHLAWAEHGPGYEKMDNQGLIVALDERKGVTWVPDAATGNATRSTPRTSERELGVCAQCHSRRAAFAKGMDHDGRFLQTHDIALITDTLYFADGQQRDEVYDVGSFLQSKMHAHGVSCSDCHDPHSGKLRAPGNAVCAQCHASTKYDVPAHTLHAAGSAGAQCAECHMPTRNYMVIDARHDHSIRIPRPDLDIALETPDACTNCHKDRTASWAAKAIEHAFGPDRKGFQTFGPALHDARVGTPDAVPQLLAVAVDAKVPAIARATAQDELRPYLSAVVMPTIEAGLADSDPMVRGAALDVLLSAPLQERVRLAFNLIDDPSAVVRIKAARVLAVVSDKGLDAGNRARLDKGFAEYLASQQANEDRPEAHINLGLFYVDRGQSGLAEKEYLAALALDPDFVPGYVNLADLYRKFKREDDADRTLTRGLQQVPGNADLDHALGLLRVRQQRMDDALPLLEQATQADRTNSRYAYVYGIALYNSHRHKEGMAVMQRAHERFPQDTDILSALIGYANDAGDTKRAAEYTRQLQALTPAVPATEP